MLAHSENTSRASWGSRRIGVQKLLAKNTLVHFESPCSVSKVSSLSGCCTNTYIKFAYPTLSNQEILGTEREIQSMTDPEFICTKDGF